MAEFAAKGESSEFGVAAAFHNGRERVLDDASGDPPTSQFVRDAQPAVAAAQQQVLGAAVCERSVVEIAALAERRNRCVDRLAGEPAATELRRDLGDRARRAREEANGDVERSRRSRARGGRLRPRRIRTDRS